MDAATRKQFVEGYQAIVKNLGTTFGYQAGGQGEPVTITAHFVDPKADDTALINALGLEARICHTLADFGPPKKFDTLTSPSGQKYVIHAAHEIFINDVLAGYKLVMKA